MKKEQNLNQLWKAAQNWGIDRDSKQKAYKNEIEQLKRKGYGGDILKEKENLNRIYYFDSLRAAKEELISEVTDYCNSKLEGLRKQTEKPMSSDQERMLNSLRRRKQVDEVELSIVKESIGNCYAATKEFEEIVAEKGYYTRPINSVSQQARDYSELPLLFRDMMEENDSIHIINGVTWNTGSEYQRQEFFTSNNSERWAATIAPYEDNPLLKDYKVYKTELSADDETLLSGMFDNYEEADLVRRVNEVYEKAPSMRDIIAVSKWNIYLNESNKGKAGDILNTVRAIQINPMPTPAVIKM